MEEQKCSGCNVNGNWEHRCHGNGCNCSDIGCRVQRNEITMKQAMEEIEALTLKQ